MPPVTFTQSATFATSPARAFATVLPAPLPGLFDRRYVALPRIREVRDQVGEWAEPGQTRTIVLADGSRMHERLVGVEAPGHFDYELSGLTGPLALLARRVEGRWAFEAAGGGTRVTWSWQVHPRSPLVRPAVLALRVMWAGYARLGLQRVGQLLAD
ncbi:SRPBCC family protein [Nocardioides aurantiacus]|uniref:Polyketide cyclase/dehydrase/lipid transport protein n=1 Tax=Nocardioides aurantiacus TaxID=86796 RepID=A0A3N2CT58_9ACTN|nr:SRPBCC family protein [Nocardioides aurantiacus]ROR90732.1 polyketide cyclase/dehydrase/lipid transport protein [Nocardioides aurantiacus]